ncbi:MAG: hypothetical protein ACLPV8_01995 [Steroidobacteraceae bacterium]
MRVLAPGRPNHERPRAVHALAPISDNRLAPSSAIGVRSGAPFQCTRFVRFLADVKSYPQFTQAVRQNSDSGPQVGQCRRVIAAKLSVRVGSSLGSAVGARFAGGR